MIFNEIKCHINTSLDLVGGCIPPCVRAWLCQKSIFHARFKQDDLVLFKLENGKDKEVNLLNLVSEL